MDAALGRQPGGVDLVSPVGDLQGIGPDDAIILQVIQGHLAAVTSDRFDEPLAPLAGVHLISAPGGDPAQGGGQRGLFEEIPFADPRSVRLGEDRLGLRESRQDLLAQLDQSRMEWGELEAVIGVIDGRGKEILEGELAELLMRRLDPGHVPGDECRPPAGTDFRVRPRRQGIRLGGDGHGIVLAGHGIEPGVEVVESPGPGVEIDHGQDAGIAHPAAHGQGDLGQRCREDGVRGGAALAQGLEPGAFGRRAGRAGDHAVLALGQDVLQAELFIEPIIDLKFAGPPFLRGEIRWGRKRRPNEGDHAEHGQELPSDLPGFHHGI